MRSTAAGLTVCSRSQIALPHIVVGSAAVSTRRSTGYICLTFLHCVFSNVFLMKMESVNDDVGSLLPDSCHRFGRQNLSTTTLLYQSRYCLLHIFISYLIFHICILYLIFHIFISYLIHHISYLWPPVVFPQPLSYNSSVCLVSVLLLSAWLQIFINFILWGSNCLLLL